MTGRMDRYLLRAVAEAWLACAATFVAIVVLFDMLANAGGYLRVADQELQVSLPGLARLLAEYYVCWLPGMYLWFAPYLTVIASMFATAKLASANEFVPMLFAGRSMFRILRPVLLTAVLSALSMAAVWEWVTPLVSNRFLALKDTLVEGKVDDSARNVLVHVSGGRQYLFCERYRPRMQQMEDVIVYERGEGSGDAKILARFADWDEAAGHWVLTAGERHQGDRIVALPTLAMPGITPETIWQLSRGAHPELVQLLSYSELARLRELRPGRHDLVLHQHVHYTLPLANLILVLLTLPFAVHFERGSRIERVVFAIGVCAAYLVFDLACRNLGLRQFVDPVVAAWAPAIVFGSFGVVFYSSLRT